MYLNYLLDIKMICIVTLLIMYVVRRWIWIWVQNIQLISYATSSINMSYYPTAANTVQITVQIYSDVVHLFVQ